LFRSYVALLRDPDVRTRSRDALAIRFVQQVLGYAGEHVDRSAILKVLMKEIKSTDILFANAPRKRSGGYRPA
jgi:hypothetical protein